jgi:hypothetical protein
VIEFKIKPHSIRDLEIVEIWCDGKFKAALYPMAEGKGVRLVSRHVTGAAVITSPFDEEYGQQVWNYLFD